MSKILVHLGGGIGDIIMATPAVNALAEFGHEVYLLIEEDVPGAVSLFTDWGVPKRVSCDGKVFMEDCFDYYFVSWFVVKPLLFRNYFDAYIIQPTFSDLMRAGFNVPQTYMKYARLIDNKLPECGKTYCGSGTAQFPEITERTVVLFPGGTKEYPQKRWDKFVELSKRMDDVAVVGIESDLSSKNAYLYPSWVRKYLSSYLKYDSKVKRIANNFSRKYFNDLVFPPHVKNYIGKLSLLDTAALIKQAGLFIGNDGGLSHMARALGVRTVVIYGPTDPDMYYLADKENLIKVGDKYECQPCRYTSLWGHNYIACDYNMRCMRSVSVERILRIIEECGALS